MSIRLYQVSSQKDLQKFIKFPFSLYKNNHYYVPPLIKFELSTLSRKSNPAFDHADSAYWLAEIDNVIVGRIAGIILDQELEEKSLARFGWVDFIDNHDVSRLLFEKAINWVKSKGATFIHGPMGFTDLDFEGALTSGYDQLATQATIYNYPYYIDHFNALGMNISASWVEVRLKVPDLVPKRISRSASLVTKRFDIKVKRFKRAKDTLKYAPEAFDILNDAYKNLYGYQKLSQKQIAYYIDQYFGFIRKEYVCIIVNSEDKVVGFALSLPSLSKALQKAKGKLFPFGFLYILKDFFFNKHVDMFLIGVKPEYQKMGANALIFNSLLSTYIKKGIKYVASGPMMSENRGVLNSWNDFDLDEANISRSCFIKKLTNHE